MGRGVEGVGGKPSMGGLVPCRGCCWLQSDRGEKRIWMGHGSGGSDAASNAPGPAVSAPSEG